MEIENWESIAKKLNKFEYRITIMYDLPTLLASISDSPQWCRLRRR